MGKASRTKKERKNSKAPIGQEMIADAAFTAALQFIMADDLAAAIQWIEVFEQSSGRSIFDQKIEFNNMDGSITEISVIMWASRHEAGECVFHLVNTAALQKHQAGQEWMQFALMAIEELPMHHSGFAILVGVMETCMEPANSGEAIETLKRAEAGRFLPRMADLARRVANRYLAALEKKGLEDDIGGGLESAASRQMRI